MWANEKGCYQKLAIFLISDSKTPEVILSSTVSRKKRKIMKYSQGILNTTWNEGAENVIEGRDWDPGQNFVRDYCRTRTTHR